MPTTFSALDTPALPDDLVDAITAQVRPAMVDPAGPLSAFLNQNAGPDQLLPFAVLLEPDEDDEYWSTEGDALADGHLQVTIYAGDKKSARLLGDRVSALIHDAPLEFQAGTLVYLRQSSRLAALDPDPGPGGGDCWQEVRIFEFKYSY